MTEQISGALEQRLEEGQAGRFRALVAAVSLGAAVALLAYRLLRNNNDE